jgi:hypothetical protein
MGPEISTVACNHCGAPLELGPTTRFLTCTHCGAKLQLHRSGNALYTEVLEAIDQRTRAMAQEMDDIRRQNELARLDREWMLRRDPLMVRGKHGGTSVPSAPTSIFGAIIGTVFGIVWTVATASTGAPAFLPLVGVVVVIVALVTGVAGVAKAMQYEDEQRSYQQRREAMMRDSRSA